MVRFCSNEYFLQDSSLQVIPQKSQVLIHMSRNKADLTTPSYVRIICQNALHLKIGLAVSELCRKGSGTGTLFVDFFEKIWKSFLNEKKKMKIGPAGKPDKKTCYQAPSI